MVRPSADSVPAEREDATAEVDERRIAKGVAIALPVLTVSTALVVAIVLGPSLSILVLAAGVLLGVIALFWASLRILSGDAPLPEELAGLDRSSHDQDPLAARKLMLVRAIKDLENERALGKLEDEDYEQITQTYRSELKEVLKRIDASVEPYRSRAEAAAREHLVKVGLIDGGFAYRGDQRPAAPAPVLADLITEPTSSANTIIAEIKEPRLACPKCVTSNEIDASFCKKCGASLADAKSEVRDEA